MSKSRISKQGTSTARLELISGHMAANLARNIGEMASGNGNSMDVQHGGPVLDSESREFLEGICREQSLENGPDNRRSKHYVFVTILSGIL